MKHRLMKNAVWGLTAAFGLVLTGCVADRDAGIDPQSAGIGGEATFQVIVPGMKTPSTRALDAAKEKEIAEIDVVIFRNADNTILEHHRIGASDISDAQSDSDYTFRVREIENTADITAALIANASVEVSAALAAVKIAGTWVGAAKTAFLSALQVSANGKWNISSSGYWTIPMYGELTVAGSIHGANLPAVRLTRMLAKVDVTNNVAPTGTPAEGDFELVSVHVVNYNTAGLVAPRWNASGAPETPPATAPNLAAGFSPGTAAWSGGNELTYALATGQTSLAGEIYLFESAAQSGNPATPEGLRLVFEGKYTSGGVTKNYFYPVDFTAPQQGGATDYMPVLRNHRYLFTVTEAAGRGYDGLGEAVVAFGVMSNLRTSLIVVDESGIRHMVWNGEHFLGVDSPAVTVTRESQDVTLNLATNYPQGWRAAVADPGTNTWLRLAGGATTATGILVDKTLTFNVSTSTDEWAMRSGTIVLTAGRLDMHIAVTQGEYRIVAEPANAYLLDGVTQHSFKVKSNTRWAVQSVSDPDGILLNSAMQIGNLLAQTGNPNTTTGEDFTFTLVSDTDGSLSGKTFTVTFYDPDGLATDMTVTLTSVACGCNGTALALSIGAGGRTYLTHMYGDKCWMVQNSMEGSSYSAMYYQNNSATSNGYYYTFGQAASACPTGWRLPTWEEATNATYGIIALTADYATNPHAMWWRGPAGTTNGAFAGRRAYDSDAHWSLWGTDGYWWCGSGSQYFYGLSNGVMPTSSVDLNYWFSVRCVRD